VALTTILIRMKQLSQLFNKINFKLFFYLIIPISLLSIGGYKNFILTPESNLQESIRLTFSELIFPYFSAALWLFFYSVVRGNLMNKRIRGINSNPLARIIHLDKKWFQKHVSIKVTVCGNLKPWWLYCLSTHFMSV
jgi:hypothetical protein